MSYGFTGNILHIDLSHRKISIEQHDEDFYRVFWGGRVLSLYYLLKYLKPKTNPFSPSNIIIFASSPLVGTFAPGLNRYTVCSKSPLTGGYGESEAGGWWGPEMKKAGFDAIVIEGKSEKPVYIWITNNTVEIRDASDFWGKESGEVQRLIRQEVGDPRARIAQIGPGGERMIRFANITNNLSHFNGRNGLGAVMGSKNLRAIAVRGTRPLNLFDKEKLTQVSKNINRKVLDNYFSQRFRKYGTTQAVQGQLDIGGLPTNNWTTGLFEDGENISGPIYRKTILKDVGSCHSCSIGCKRIVEINDTDIQVDPMYGGPEYEAVAALGSLCGVSDLRYIAKANELCNKFCIDTISTGNTIAFAMQCFEKGILTKKDTYGIDLRFGNKTAMITLIEKIGKREKGLGEILSEGSVVAATIIGKGSERLIHHVKGQEIPMHDPRVKTGLGLQYAFSDNGADHMKAPHDGFFVNDDSFGTVELSGLGIHQGVPLTDISRDKIRLFKITNFYGMVLDILCACRFMFVPLGPGTLEDFVDIVHSITGWRITWYELMTLAERSINMARVFNVREGFSSAQDTIPDVFFENVQGGPLDGKASINRKDFDMAKLYYYEIMGWSTDGIPTKQKLSELDLDWLASYHDDN